MEILVDIPIVSCSFLPGRVGNVGTPNHLMLVSADYEDHGPGNQEGSLNQQAANSLRGSANCCWTTFLGAEETFIEGTPSWQTQVDQ